MKTPMAWKKQLATIVVVGVIALYQYFQNEQAGAPAQNEQRSGSSDISQIESWRSGQWVQLDATVTRLLADDNEGSRHQRFIINPGGNHTLLVAHNIDLAKRAPYVKATKLACADVSNRIIVVALFTGRIMTRRVDRVGGLNIMGKGFSKW